MTQKQKHGKTFEILNTTEIPIWFCYATKFTTMTLKFLFVRIDNIDSVTQKKVYWRFMIHTS